MVQKQAGIGLGLIFLVGLPSAFGREAGVEKGAVKRAVKQIEDGSFGRDAQYGQQSGDFPSCERVATRESRAEGQSVESEHRSNAATTSK